MTQKKIIVVGSINLDLVASVARLPTVGETLTGQQFATYSGGKGANQAVCAARLGGSVSLVGRLGDDSFAVNLRETLQAAGVETDAVENVAGPSGLDIDCSRFYDELGYKETLGLRESLERAIAFERAA